MYLEWLAQPDVLEYFQWGEEGVTFEWVDGLRVLNAQDNQGDMWMGHQGNKDYWALVVELRVQGDALSTATNVIPMGLPDSDRLRQEQADRYLYLRVRADHGLTYNDPMIGTATPAVGEHRGALASLFQQLATQLVKTNPDNFNAMYEEHVATYRAAGYADIEAQRGAAFDNGYVTRLNPIARGDEAFNWWSIGSVTSNVYD
jgi:putative aldouronate transport system substrate-binding protein